MTEKKDTNRRRLVGQVVSNKMDKTVVVKVSRQLAHPLYGKVIRKSKKFHAHDEQNQCRVGDTVEIKECRPLSKTKTWVLASILERGEAEDTSV